MNYKDKFISIEDRLNFAGATYQSKIMCGILLCLDWEAEKTKAKSEKAESKVTFKSETTEQDITLKHRSLGKQVVTYIVMMNPIKQFNNTPLESFQIRTDYGSRELNIDMVRLANCLLKQKEQGSELSKQETAYVLAVAANTEGIRKGLDMHDEILKAVDSKLKNDDFSSVVKITGKKYSINMEQIEKIDNDKFVY